MRVGKIWSATVAGALLLTAGIAVPAHAVAGETAKVDGVVEVVENEGFAPGAGEYRQAVRLPSGERVPVALSGVRPGDRVSLTLDVPADVASAAADGGTVPGIGGAVRVTRRELQNAQSAPASSSSALSRATAADAVGDGRPVLPRAVAVLSNAQSATGSIAGTQDLYVAIVAPKGVKGAVATRAQVATQVAGAAAYWREQSHGRIELRLAKTVGAYASDYSCADDPFKMWTEAARAVGFSDGPGKHLVMVLPREAAAAGCSYGLASMGTGVRSGGVVYVADVTWPVLAHEIGHNFGLSHAKSLACTSRTDAALGASGCSVDEYGDPFDVMGASAQSTAGSLSIPGAARIGLVPSSSVATVTGGTRRVTLRPVSSLSGVRAARVQDPRTGAVYWVEFRTHTGRDTRLYVPATSGVRILREESGNAWPGTIALDASPTGKSVDVDRALPTGSVFTSYGAGVSVAVRSASNAAATVDVTVTSSASRSLGGVKPGVVFRATTSSRPKAAVRSAAPAVPAVAVSSKGIVSWKATNGVTYDATLRRKVGRSYGRTQVWYSRTSRTSAKLTAARGSVVQIQVRARGKTGTLGRWSGWRTVKFA